MEETKNIPDDFTKSQRARYFSHGNRKNILDDIIKSQRATDFSDEELEVIPDNSTDFLHAMELLDMPKVCTSDFLDAERRKIIDNILKSQGATDFSHEKRKNILDDIIKSQRATDFSHEKTTNIPDDFTKSQRARYFSHEKGSTDYAPVSWRGHVAPDHLIAPQSTSSWKDGSLEGCNAKRQEEFSLWQNDSGTRSMSSDTKYKRINDRLEQLEKSHETFSEQLNNLTATVLNLEMTSKKIENRLDSDKEELYQGINSDTEVLKTENDALQRGIESIEAKLKSLQEDYSKRLFTQEALTDKLRSINEKLQKKVEDIGTQSGMKSTFFSGVLLPPRGTLTNGTCLDRVHKMNMDEDKMWDDVEGLMNIAKRGKYMFVVEAMQKGKGGLGIGLAEYKDDRNAPLGDFYARSSSTMTSYHGDLASVVLVHDCFEGQKIRPLVWHVQGQADVLFCNVTACWLGF